MPSSCTYLLIKYSITLFFHSIMLPPPSYLGAFCWRLERRRALEARPLSLSYGYGAPPAPWRSVSTKEVNSCSAALPAEGAGLGGEGLDAPLDVAYSLLMTSA